MIPEWLLRHVGKDKLFYLGNDEAWRCSLITLRIVAGARDGSVANGGVAPLIG